MIDKHGLLARRDLRDVVIELGCGPLKRHAGSIAIDILDGEHVDVVGDALDVLRALPAGCAKLVSSSHFLEHLHDAGPILDEMSRVLGPGGEIEIVVPHFANPYFHSDPTHRNGLGFGLYTMSYFARDPLLRRQVPGYVRRSTRYLQELWEENLCYLFPCYEIRYVLGRTADLPQGTRDP